MIAKGAQPAGAQLGPVATAARSRLTGCGFGWGLGWFLGVVRAGVGFFAM